MGPQFGAVTSPRSDSLFPSLVESSSCLILQMLQRSQIPLPRVLNSPRIDLQLYEGDRPYLLIALLHLYGLLIEQVSSAGQPGSGIYMRN